MNEEEQFYLYNKIEEFNPPEDLVYLLKYFKPKYSNIIKHLIKFGNIDNVTKFQGIKLTKLKSKYILKKYNILIREMSKAEIEEDYDKIILIKNGNLVVRTLS